MTSPFVWMAQQHAAPPTPPTSYPCPLCLPPARPGVHEVAYAERLVCAECVEELQVANDVLVGVGDE